MELILEQGGTRTYRAPDDSVVEVHAEIRGQFSDVWHRLDSDEEDVWAETKDNPLRVTMERMVRAQLAAWFAGPGDDLGLEPIEGTVEVTWVDFPLYDYIEDEDGDAQAVFPAVGVVYRCVVEQGCWPAVPE